MAITHLKGAYYDSDTQSIWTLDASGTYVQLSIGGGVTIYTGDGSLSGNRTVDLNGHQLLIGPDVFPSSTHFFIDPVANIVEFNAYDPTGDGNIAKINISSGPSQPDFTFIAQFNDGEKVAQIQGIANVSGSSLEYTADTHTIHNAIITPELAALDFANDAAAAIGGVAVNQWYHTSGILKIR